MINFADVRIFLCTTPTQMTYSFDRLMGRAQEVFDQDPSSGHLFLFVNRNRDRMKILFWDRDGFCIWYKRLERGSFQVLTTTSDTEGVELDYKLFITTTLKTTKKSAKVAIVPWIKLVRILRGNWSSNSPS